MMVCNIEIFDFNMPCKVHYCALFYVQLSLQKIKVTNRYWAWRARCFAHKSSWLWRSSRLISYFFSMNEWIWNRDHFILKERIRIFKFVMFYTDSRNMFVFLDRLTLWTSMWCSVLFIKLWNSWMWERSIFYSHGRKTQTNDHPY